MAQPGRGGQAGCPMCRGHYRSHAADRQRATDPAADSSVRSRAGAGLARDGSAGDRKRAEGATIMTAPADPNSLIWALNTRLIAGATATETLLAWCEERGLADGPITVDVLQRFAPAIVPDDVLPALELDP